MQQQQKSCLLMSKRVCDYEQRVCVCMCMCEWVVATTTLTAKRDNNWVNEFAKEETFMHVRIMLINWTNCLHIWLGIIPLKIIIKIYLCFTQLHIYTVLFAKILNKFSCLAFLYTHRSVANTISFSYHKLSFSLLYLLFKESKANKRRLVFFFHAFAFTVESILRLFTCIKTHTHTHINFLPSLSSVARLALCQTTNRDGCEVNNFSILSFASVVFCVQLYKWNSNAKCSFSLALTYLLNNRKQFRFLFHTTINKSLACTYYNRVFE